MYVKLVVLLAAVAAVSASPLEPVKDSCTVTSYDQVEAAVQSCSSLIIRDLNVPAKTTLELDLKTGASLAFEGTLTWEYAEWEGPLLQITGSKVTITADGATLDGQGAKWWDGKGDHGKKKPKFFRIKTTGGSHVKNFHLLNCPRQCVSINTASDTTVDGFYLDVAAGDSEGGHNTDGFDVSSSSNIVVQNAVVKNQDDCVAVNQGQNLAFHNLTCSGGHGLSLSVGQSSENGEKNTVSNITFSDCTVSNSDNGIHVKTHTDAGTGAVNDVTYKNIKLSGIRKYAINVQEDYKKGKSSGKPKGNIPIKNLQMSSITGSMSGDHISMAVYILCGDDGCNTWNWSDISITNTKKDNSCNYEPSGFTC